MWTTETTGGDKDRLAGSMIVVTLTLWCFAVAALAAQEVEEEPPVYIPPLYGSPQNLVAGATRKPAEQTLVLRVLAPLDHTGLTLDPQPTLYWYVSDHHPPGMEFTLIETQALEPALVSVLTSPPRAGIADVRLKDEGIQLKTGIEYQWFVSTRNDKPLSKETVAQGRIQRVEREPELASKLKGASRLESAYIYAAAGIWYDVIQVLSEEIAARPTQGSLRAKRASLLEAVGLGIVAEFDRSSDY